MQLASEGSKGGNLCGQGWLVGRAGIITVPFLLLLWACWPPRSLLLLPLYLPTSLTMLLLSPPLTPVPHHHASAITSTYSFYFTNMRQSSPPIVYFSRYNVPVLASTHSCTSSTCVDPHLHSLLCSSSLLCFCSHPQRTFSLTLQL